MALLAMAANASSGCAATGGQNNFPPPVEPALQREAKFPWPPVLRFAAAAYAVRRRPPRPCHAHEAAKGAGSMQEYQI